MHIKRLVQSANPAARLLIRRLVAVHKLYNSQTGTSYLKPGALSKECSNSWLCAVPPAQRPLPNRSPQEKQKTNIRVHHHRGNAAQRCDRSMHARTRCLPQKGNSVGCKRPTSSSQGRSDGSHGNQGANQPFNKGAPPMSRRDRFCCCFLSQEACKWGAFNNVAERTTASMGDPCI